MKRKIFLAGAGIALCGMFVWQSCKKDAQQSLQTTSNADNLTTPSVPITDDFLIQFLTNVANGNVLYNMPLNSAIAGAEAWSNFKIADHKNTAFGATYISTSNTSVNGTGGLIKGVDVQTLTNNVAALVRAALSQKQLPGNPQNMVVGVDVTLLKTVPINAVLSQYVLRVVTVVGGVVDRTTGAAVPCNYSSSDYWVIEGIPTGGNCSSNNQNGPGSTYQMMNRLNQLGCGYTSYRAAMIPHFFLQTATNASTGNEFFRGSFNTNATATDIKNDYKTNDLCFKTEFVAGGGLGSRDCLDPTEMDWHTHGAFRVATNPYYVNQVVPQPNTGSWLVLAYTVQDHATLCGCPIKDKWWHGLYVLYGKEIVLPSALTNLVSLP